MQVMLKARLLRVSTDTHVLGEHSIYVYIKQFQNILYYKFPKFRFKASKKCLKLKVSIKIHH